MYFVGILKLLPNVTHEKNVILPDMLCFQFFIYNSSVVNTLLMHVCIVKLVRVQHNSGNRKLTV